MAITDQDPGVKDEFEQVVDKLRTANNILVTVSTDPTVDEFAACIGLTLILNKLGKHANAVFSGKVPSTIDFLKPEKTLEKDTNSLRDFIIALDKSKADKLRYKVEDDVVKIFITPYKTSISEKDLEFSQGDFNVDAVLALGVQDKNHIDKAILAHGRILHDASVISVNTSKQSKVGSINWSDTRASSLCEMVADIASELDGKIFDSQNATALLTGIVAETDRYSNDKAAPHTMSVAGLLMSAGASTQLVSSELAQSTTQPSTPVAEQQLPEGEETGLLEIEHVSQEEPAATVEPSEIPEAPPKEDLPPPPVGTQEPPMPDNPPAASSTPPTQPPEETSQPPESKKPVITKSRVMHEPPEFDGKLTANSEPEEKQYSGSVDPLSNVPDTPLLSKPKVEDKDFSDTLLPETDDSNVAKGKNLPAIDDNDTLSSIEEAVDSPHLAEKDDDTTATGSTGLDDARDAVLRAQTVLNGQPDSERPEARQDMGTNQLGPQLHDETESAKVDSDKKDQPPPPVPPPYTPPDL